MPIKNTVLIVQQQVDTSFRVLKDSGWKSCLRQSQEQQQPPKIARFWKSRDASYMYSTGQRYWAQNAHVHEIDMRMKYAHDAKSLVFVS